MSPEPPTTPGAADNYAVHITEQPDGWWSITITRAGRPAPFFMQFREAAPALVMAKAVALTEGADLIVRTAAGRNGAGERVPAAQIARYELPSRG